MKTTDFIVEYAGIGNDAEAMGADHEVQLARQDLYNTAKNAIELHARLKNISEETGLEGWVSEKITLAADYLATVNNYFAEQDQPDMDMLDSFSFESAEQQFNQLVNENEDHPDEEEDKKLIKKMVKPAALKDGKVDEADKHSIVGKIQRGHELKKKVDSTWTDLSTAQQAGDGSAASRAFRKHERYANLERPGTWTKVKEEGVTETSKGKIDRYTKAASDAHGHADFMSRAAGPGQEKFAQDQRKIADKRAAGLRRAAKRGEKSDVEESSDNEPFNYEEWKASSIKPRKPRGWRDAELLGQQQREADRKRKEQSSQQDMTGQTCEKCKKGTYQERSQHDDMEDKVTCSCGHRVDRWKNYQAEGVADVVKGIKRKVAGKQDPKEVQYQHGFRARQAIDASRKFNNQAAYDNEKKMVDRYNKVHKVVNKEDVAKGPGKSLDELNTEYSHHIELSRKYSKRGNQDKAQYHWSQAHSILEKISAHPDYKLEFEDDPYAAQKNDAYAMKNDSRLGEQGVEEGYTVTRGIDRERYQERAGLEGPFATKIGKVVYYDPREGKYYDPDTDMYIEYDDWKAMNEASDPSGIFTAAQHNHAFIVTAEVDSKRKKFRVYHQNANLAKQKFLQHHSMATVLDVKPEAAKQVTELDASTMQAYLNKRKETATPASAHQAVKQAQGVRSAKEKIADKEVMKKARQVGRVTESRSPVNDFGIDIRTIKKSDKVYIDLDGRRKAFVVINKTTFPNGMFAIKVADKNQVTGYSLVNFLDVEKVSKAARVSENELTELSNTTLNAYIPKANRSRDQATKDMQASGKYDPKVDEKMGRRAEFTMRAKNKVNEAGGEPNTDQILEYLTSGYLMLRDNRNMFTEEGFATIERIYNGLRYDLKDGNYAGFMRSYSEYMGKYPDASVELIDAMFEAAGLESEKGTIEQFLALCSESVSSSKPVVESASAGGTSAGAIATGVAGAATGKPGTGKPKKVSNVIKRNKPAFGKGVY